MSLYASMADSHVHVGLLSRSQVEHFSHRVLNIAGRGRGKGKGQGGHGSTFRRTSCNVPSYDMT